MQVHSCKLTLEPNMTIIQDVTIIQEYSDQVNSPVNQPSSRIQPFNNWCTYMCIYYTYKLWRSKQWRNYTRVQIQLFILYIGIYQNDQQLTSSIRIFQLTSLYLPHNDSAPDYFVVDYSSLPVETPLAARETLACELPILAWRCRPTPCPLISPLDSYFYSNGL